MRRGSDAKRWDDLANLLGLGEDLVKAAILAGELPGYRIGRRYVIPNDAFEAVANGTWRAQPRPVLNAGPQLIGHRKANRKQREAAKREALAATKKAA